MGERQNRTLEAAGSTPVCSTTFRRRWKQGKQQNPTLDTVKKIADALGVSLDVLMK